MRVFGCEFEQQIVDAIAEHAERAYPDEACGLVLGPPDGPRLTRAEPIRNVQDRYHALEPERFSRTARDGFRLDALGHRRVLEAAEADGLVERVLYHSHPDAGAYLSPEDRAAAVREGIELMPGVVHVVVSVRNGHRAGAAAFRYDSARAVFDEMRIPLEGARSTALPDLSARAMDGPEQARPIAPVGGALTPRCTTAAEWSALAGTLAPNRIAVDGNVAAQLGRFAQGLLSPLSGFMGPVELGAVAAKGRLPDGTPWQAPITLDVLARDLRLDVQAGARVGLERWGRTVAALALDVVRPLATSPGQLRLSGALFIDPDAFGGPSAADTRAELFRRSMKRVLAVPTPVTRCDAVATFDGYLAPGRQGPDPDRTLGLVVDPGPATWLTAVIAQNLGATHILIEDPRLAELVRTTLDIQPWCP